MSDISQARINAHREAILREFEAHPQLRQRYIELVAGKVPTNPDHAEQVAKEIISVLFDRAD